MQKNFRVQVLKRMLSPEELRSFQAKQKRAKLKGSWSPNSADWQLFEKNTKLTPLEWQKYWKLKAVDSVYRRIGRMFLLEDLLRDQNNY